MVAEALDITRETYLAILMDRELMGPVIIGSPQGGMDIEEVAEKTPEAIFTVRASFVYVSSNFHYYKMCDQAKWVGTHNIDFEI